MLKKANKWVSLLVALTFLVSLAVPFAGNAPVAKAAVSEQVDLDQVVARLNAIDLVQGYPDGTFGLDKNITRAEFAAIVDRALGLESAAQSAKGATQFSDVPADHWASGYINLATGNGVIIGYPDGTFKPEANVNYAEAATMLVRALGYEPAVAASAGTWPNNYLSKGGELGVLDDVSFANWSTAAVRGDVFLMLDNSLDVGIMKQTSYGTEISYEESDETILSRYLKVTVLDDDWADENEEDLPTVVKTARTNMDTLAADELQFDNYKPSKVFTAIAGINPNDFQGLQAQVWINDDDEIVYMAPSEDQTLVADVIDSDVGDYANAGANGGIDFKKANKVYKFAEADPVIYVNNTQVDRANLFANYTLKDANIKAVLNKDDEIVSADIFDYVHPGVNDSEVWLVKDVDTEDEIVEFYAHTDGAEDSKDLSGVDYLVVKNGQPATLADLEPFDVVNAFPGANDAWYLVATDKTVSGEASVATGDRTKVSSYDIFVDGKKYDVNFGLTFSSDGNDTIEEPDPADLDDLEGVEVTVYLDNAGWVRHVMTTQEVAGAKNMAIISSSPVKEYSTNNYTMSLLKADGQEVTVTFDPKDVDFYYYNGTTKKGPVSDATFKNLIEVTSEADKVYTIETGVNITLQIGAGGDSTKPDSWLIPVEYKLSSSGKLTQLVLRNDLLSFAGSGSAGNGLVLDEDDDTATINGRVFRATNDTVVFDLTDGLDSTVVGDITYYSLDDPAVTNWSAVESKGDVKLAAKTDKDKLEYLYVVQVSGSLAAKGQYGIVTNLTVKGGDDALEILGMDNSKTVYVINSTVSGSPSVAKGDFVYYEVNADNEVDVGVIARSSSKNTVVSGVYTPTVTGTVYLNDGYLTALRLDSAEIIMVDSATSTSIKGTDGDYRVLSGSVKYADVHSLSSLKLLNGVSKYDVVLVLDTDDDGGSNDYVVLLADYSDRPSGAPGDPDALKVKYVIKP